MLGTNVGVEYVALYPSYFVSFVNFALRKIHVKFTLYVCLYVDILHVIGIKSVHINILNAYILYFVTLFFLL